ncbi:MAG: hypothetical protein M3436_01450 [Pseudomonadota bacterium]|nr:hypothetical protein [Pseudomonadota bacterium]
MRARLREGFAQFFAKLKDRALEWAATATLASILSAVFLVEDFLVSWVVTVDSIWIVRAFIALLAAYFGLALWLIWTVPRPQFDELSGTYIDRHTGLHYCTQCRKEGHRVELRKSKTGWRCFGCGTYYPKLRDSSEA